MMDFVDVDNDSVLCPGCEQEHPADEECRICAVDAEEFLNRVEDLENVPSKVYTIDHVVVEIWENGFHGVGMDNGTTIPRCDSCGGFGCDACDNTGDAAFVRNAVNEAKSRYYSEA